MCARQTEPFTFVKIHEELNDRSMDVDQVRSAVGYAYKKGQLIQVAPGGPGKPAVYRVSKGWLNGKGKKSGTAGTPSLPASGKEQASPDGSTGSGRLRIEGLDPEPELTLQQQLEKACKERNDARSKGQHNLARILQDKVNKLEERLAAA